MQLEYYLTASNAVAEVSCEEHTEKLPHPSCHFNAYSVFLPRYFLPGVDPITVTCRTSVHLKHASDKDSEQTDSTLQLELRDLLITGAGAAVPAVSFIHCTV